MFLLCSTDLEALLKGVPDVTGIVLRRPTLRLTPLRGRRLGRGPAFLPARPPRQRGDSRRERDDRGLRLAADPRRSLTLREVNLTLFAPDAVPPARCGNAAVRGIGSQRPGAADRVVGPDRSGPAAVDGLRHNRGAGVLARVSRCRTRRAGTRIGRPGFAPRPSRLVLEGGLRSKPKGTLQFRYCRATEPGAARRFAASSSAEQPSRRVPLR